MRQNIDLVVALEQLPTAMEIPFTFKAKNHLGYSVDVYARMENKADWRTNQAFTTMISEGAKLGILGAAAEKYFLVDWINREEKPATDTVEELELRVQYYGDPGTGVPRPRIINTDQIIDNITFIDFSSGTYAVVDTDTFEADLEGWTKTDEVGASTIDRSQTHVRNGAWAMRHSALDNGDVGYLTKSFAIGAVSKAYILVPTYFELVDDEEIILEIITDAGGVTKKRTNYYCITGRPSGGTIITKEFLYLAAELPVDDTYEVRLRATCESGAGLELFYDDIKVITKA